MFKNKLASQPKLCEVWHYMLMKNTAEQLPKARIYKLKRDINRVLAKGCASTRFIARLCGQCISFTKAIVPTKLLLRNLYRLLSTRKSWSDNLKIDKSSSDDLNWWVSALASLNGKPIINKTVQGQCAR